MITKKFCLPLLACSIALASSFAVAIEPLPASDATRHAQEQVRNNLDLSDMQDFSDVNRGLIKATPNVVVRGEEGNVVWDMDVYHKFLKGDAPDTVNPSLWRQALLNNHAGLYEVVDGIYQVRGYDLTTMSIIRGDTGWIVIDPLTMTEVAEAALKLVNDELGERPVKAVIYTHSHPDHFGGVKGVISQQDVDSGDVKVIAPEHFMEHVGSEMSLLGTAMSRRAQYMHAIVLPRGPREQVDNGLGKGVSNGTFTLIEPTDYVTATGETLTVDGIDIEFQLTPAAEADAEMMFYFPQFKALMGAENLNAGLHNLLTPRGAKSRDALGWSKALDLTMQMFGDRTDVVFTSHYWPRWGRDNIHNYIAKQRDMLKYLHDQTLRLANLGYKRDEIAEHLKVPDSLGKEWFNRGYYGTVTHNVKGIYQHYLGFWSGNPATLHELPQAEAGKHYVAALGGADEVMKQASTASKQGNYRWAAMLMNHLVMSEPDNQAARNQQAEIFEQMGYQAESGSWRNIYLTGARELRHGVSTDKVPNSASADMLRALSVEQIFDLIAVRLNGPKAEGEKLAIGWKFTDSNQAYQLTLEHSVLHNRPLTKDAQVDLTLSLERETLNRILLQETSFKEQIESNAIHVDGDPAVLSRLFGLLDEFTPDFKIVTSAAGHAR